jgi:hypothetical protein
VKVRIDAWILAAKISEGKVFRPVNKGIVQTAHRFRTKRRFLWDAQRFRHRGAQQRRSSGGEKA